VCTTYQTKEAGGVSSLQMRLSDIQCSSRHQLGRQLRILASYFK
jgi:hypothetical protein